MQLRFQPTTSVQDFSLLWCVMYVGSINDLKANSEEEKDNFQIVHPICLTCKQQGHKERTSGEKKKLKRRNTSDSSS